MKKLSLLSQIALIYIQIVWTYMKMPALKLEGFFLKLQTKYYKWQYSKLQKKIIKEQNEILRILNK